MLEENFLLSFELPNVLIESGKKYGKKFNQNQF